ncbi:RNA polymerase subunit sigma [Paenibacillus sp. H1-7]|uniref:RNA polymerase subunit sigma n=1 Tax=Paenibacillus sp. H1-7 TaxID=2282849 RepID=UPI001EF9168E|nr:RNA polymerase subunit sigma [Paenibacillus sp. H1-7]
MQVKIGLLIAAILVVLTGCFSSAKDPVVATISPAQDTVSSNEFRLSAREQEVYINFEQDLKEQHLKELDPISIAKLYVQASLDGKNEVVYALYTDRKGHVQWTKEEHEQFAASDRGTKDQILKIFKHIETGKFIQTSDSEGYIEYQSNKDAENKPENKSGFKMIKDEDGIWNVSFQPIQ